MLLNGGRLRFIELAEAEGAQLIHAGMNRFRDLIHETISDAGGNPSGGNAARGRILSEKYRARLHRFFTKGGGVRVYVKRMIAS